MKNPIPALLCEIYGPKSGLNVERLVAGLIEKWSPAQQDQRIVPPAAALSERDVLLITYADQVHQAGESPLRTLAGFATRSLKGTVSGIHLLPFYPWSSDDGFSVKEFLEVDPSLGSWGDVERLGADFDLMFDGVFNHVSAQGEWFRGFLAGEPGYRNFFISVAGNPDLSRVVRPRTLPLLTEFSTVAGPKRIWTTFSADQVDLNFENPAVLLQVLEALLFYVARGARFIRLDAIAFLWKEIGTTCLHLPQTHAIIRLMRAVLDAVAPHVLLITETNVPHVDNVSYFGDGSDEAQLVYNFALPPLVLHSLQGGNATALTQWAQSLSLPSERVAFFNFLASHDGIGLNPVRGILTEGQIEQLVQGTLDHGGSISYKAMPDGSRQPYELNINYLDALSNPAAPGPMDEVVRKFLTAQAILLSLQGMPGIYFHSLFGSRGDRAGALASGIPRRINREKLDLARLEAALADRGSLRASIFALYRALLRVRRQQPAFRPTAPQRVLSLDARVFTVLRQSRDGADTVLCLHNVSRDALTVSVEAILPTGCEWQTLWSSNRHPITQGALLLEPYGTSWLSAASLWSPPSPTQ